MSESRTARPRHAAAAHYDTLLHIPIYAHTTLLSAQIVEWYVHKDLCSHMLQSPGSRGGFECSLATSPLGHGACDSILDASAVSDPQHAPPPTRQPRRRRLTPEAAWPAGRRVEQDCGAGEAGGREAAAEPRGWRRRCRRGAESRPPSQAPPAIFPPNTWGRRVWPSQAGRVGWSRPRHPGGPRGQAWGRLRWATLGRAGPASAGRVWASTAQYRASLGESAPVQHSGGNKAGGASTAGRAHTRAVA